MVRKEILSKFNKRGDPNKAVEGGKNPEINKRACPFIRDLRVGTSSQIS